MTVPTRIEAATLLISLDPPPWFFAPALGAAGAAGWRAVRMTVRMEANGCRVERRSTASLTRVVRPELVRA